MKFLDPFDSERTEEYVCFTKTCVTFVTENTIPVSKSNPNCLYRIKGDSAFLRRGTL